MVNSCAAYDCTNRRVKGDGMKWGFHYKIKNYVPNGLLRWNVIKFIPAKNSYLCGGHFIASDYKFVDSIKP